MDPSTLGMRTFIPIQEFDERWHNRDDGIVEDHCAMVFKRPAELPSYDENNWIYLEWLLYPAVHSLYNSGIYSNVFGIICVRGRRFFFFCLKFEFNFSLDLPLSLNWHGLNAHFTWVIRYHCMVLYYASIKSLCPPARKPKCRRDG